jgi:NADH:ubiquinone oxidoreductase subunit 2 (subunit N)
MYLTLIILPLLGSIFSGFFGRKIGIKGSHLITCSSIIITTVLSILIFFEVGFNNIPVTINIARWIDVESLNVLWSFKFDSLTVSMLLPVLIVSSLVHIYSISYMSHDPHNPRFFSYLSLFTFMMIILVTGNNYLLMFVGWEGVGICSYLLVNFWFTRIAANQSSISAFLTNRVGDCFLTIGIFAILWSFGNIDYNLVFSLVPYYNENIITIIGICLLIGATAKSSQVGLHIWLPQAMEGPTPVSALIHAATMVTAGVYLLMRSSPLIEYSSTVLVICLWLGAITTIFSSLIGLFQQDIKKVIAYSTMSQLAQEYNLIIFRHQTICVEVIIKNIYIILLIINSQITKAHDYIYYNHIRDSLFNSSFTQWLYYNTLKYVNMSVRWKIITISKLVGISEAIRLILIFVKLIIINLTVFIFIKYLFNLPYNMTFSIISCIRDIQNNHTNFTESKTQGNSDNNKKNKDLSFKQWLAGLIDGDGYFLLTKRGYKSCEITMDTRDAKALYEIKQKYGGAIKPISNANAVKYKLRHKKGLISLINDVNGLIRNPTRLLQMNKLCLKYEIKLKYPGPLSFNNGWFSGFIDSDGSVYYNEVSGQVFISVSQKNRYLLEPLIAIYGGRVDILSPNIEAFKYVVYRKAELFNLIDNYFTKYPLKTKKMKRVNLIKDFYLLRVNRNSQDIIKLNEWIKYKDRWEKYQD